MSDDEELDFEFESLMATRAKRSNAGSRLKKLLELEEQNDISNNQFTTEDDENVNLLFQEEGEDEEFIDEDIDNENLDGIDEEEEEDDQDQDDLSRKRKLEDQDEDEEPEVNSDEQLSDSDISASDTDESEGEKELQKQERLKKRKSRKNIVPEIKKPTNQSPIKKKPKTQLITSNSLLLSSRRSSARAAAVESKQALIDKLKESELRKAKYAHRHIRHKQIELTQEQRLAQAIKTEEENIESLNRFKEQEIVKKERQKHLLLLRRIELRNVIRLISKETFIEPIEEVLDARKQWEHYTRIRKRLSKKKLSQMEENQLFTSKMPFTIDYDQPYQKALIEERKQQEIKRLTDINDQLKEKLVENYKNEKEENMDVNSIQEENKQEAIPIETKKDEGEIDLDNQGDQDSGQKEDVQMKEPSGEEDTQIDLSNKEIEDNEKSSGNNKDEEVKTENFKDEKESNQEKGVEKIDDSDREIKVDHKTITDNTIESAEIDDNQINKKDNPEEMEVESVQDKENGNPAIDGTIEEAETEIEPQELENPNIGKDESLKENTPNEIKRVTFVDEVENKNIPSQEETPIPEMNQNKEIFQGPAQRVGRETVYLINFDENDNYYSLSSTNVKSILFGDQAILPASRRFKDVKTILHIGKNDNPYAKSKSDNKDNLLESVLKLTEEDPMFDDLKRLPRLGVKQDLIEEVEDTKEDNSAEIILKTEAPTGLYLPNGNKKNCMISGTEVKYFDPSTGIPYSSVEVYKFLKLIEQGNVPWYSFDDKSNDTGIAELYLGSRDGTTRHAKGVPEGFEV